MPLLFLVCPDSFLSNKDHSSKRRMGRLGYASNSLSHRKAHLLVFAAHLEPSYTTHIPGQCRVEDAAPEFVDGQEEHEIKGFVRRFAELTMRTVSEKKKIYPICCII